MENEERKAMGARIKEWRQALKLSQEALAEKLGMKRTNVANYEAGRVVPPGNIILELAKIFGVTTDAILGNEETIYETGIAIKEEREVQGISIKELGEITGISEENLIKYENDESPLSVETANKIASAFGMTFAELLHKYDLGGYVHQVFNGDVNAQIKYTNTVKVDAVKEQEDKYEPELTAKDERDIQKELQRLIDGLEGKNGYAAFDGQTLEDMDEEDKELLIISLENSLRLAKRLAKQKFTPKKYRQ